MNKIYLLLGSNLGNKAAYLQQARDLISVQVGSITQASSVYETEAWGYTDQPSFYNQVLAVDSALAADVVLEKILAIELKLGRTRLHKWHERTIDIDILYFNNDIIHHDDLQVPHPEIPNRRFTLLPLTEIAPTALHPVLGLTNAQLLARCPDTLDAKRLAL